MSLVIMRVGTLIVEVPWFKLLWWSYCWSSSVLSYFVWGTLILKPLNHKMVNGPLFYFLLISHHKPFHDVPISDITHGSFHLMCDGWMKLPAHQ